jgi:hypothetical protein
MEQGTRVALERFFGMSTWPKQELNDEDRFFDFVVAAFKNGDTVISQADMETIAVGREDNGQLSEHQLSALGVYESKFKDGISILDKYVAE